MVLTAVYRRDVYNTRKNPTASATALLTSSRANYRFLTQDLKQIHLFTSRQLFLGGSKLTVPACGHAQCCERVRWLLFCVRRVAGSSRLYKELYDIDICALHVTLLYIPCYSARA